MFERVRKLDKVHQNIQELILLYGKMNCRDSYHCPESSSIEKKKRQKDNIPSCTRSTHAIIHIKFEMCFSMCEVINYAMSLG